MTITREATMTASTTGSRAPGMPCWIDLPCTRPGATRQFYTELFGWRYETKPDIAGGDYTFALLGDQPVAGLYTAPHGHPSQWRIYLTTPDVLAVAARLPRLGAQVLTGPLTLPGHGTMLVVRHPGGACISLWQAAAEWPFLTGVPGSFIWAELSTRDGRGADHFFRDLFGYEQEQLGDVRHFDYSVWSLDGQVVLGRIRMGHAVPGTIPPHWLTHLVVDPDVGTDDTALHAARIGGRIRVRPYDTEFGRIAVLDDPSHATFAIIDPTQAIIDDGSAEVDDPNDD
ncbi:VOC family protein [Solihabitans fulvus]|uniref:VOC family protein n=1 Tax=Solihabitans fulvus TaxID=1892852 RepID=A0A5B2XGN3_9PSEU|nr:VOC family protein [Solihabitans fulvus]KAA2261942.1 VOC family protein [Solihabitans fulvus]